jgi:hypothetical protein
MRPVLAGLVLTALSPATTAGDLPPVTALVLEGDTVAGVGDVTTTAAVALAPDGSWAVEVDTDHADTDRDGAVLGPSGLMFREGDPVLAPAGATMDSFGPISTGLDDTGKMLWNLALDGTSGSGDDSGLYLGDVPVMQEGDVLFGDGLPVTGAPLRGIFHAHLTDDSFTGYLDALVMASLDVPDTPTTIDRALLRVKLFHSGTLVGIEVIAQEGDVLPGQTEAVADLETSVSNVQLNRHQDVMFIADLEGDSSVDHVVYKNGVVLAQEGGASPVPGRDWDLLSLAELSLANNGRWAIQGSLEGDTADDDVIVIDDEVFIREGDPVPGLPGKTIASLGTTGASGPIFLGDNGNLLWSARWNGPAGQDKGLFLNDRLVAQIGVTTVAGGTLAEIFAVTEGYVLDEVGRRVLFRGRLDDGRDGAFLIDVGPWVSLGNGKAGVGGVTPCLVGSGDFIVGSTLALTLTDAPPNSTTNLVFGTFGLFAPLKGGVLVPNADQVTLGLPVDGAGTYELTTITPPGVLPGYSVWFQHWIDDPGASFGLAASNGVRANTP